MEIFSAIQLSDARAVCPEQGDLGRMTVTSAQPCGVARRFIRAGVRNLHIVDLEGARSGEPWDPTFVEIEALVQQGNAFIQVGGGIRTEEHLLRYLRMGVHRVILGTAAVESAAFVRRMASRYGDKIAVSVDVKDGMAAIHGWTKAGGAGAAELCRRLRDDGIGTVICTDVLRSGMLSGVDTALYRELLTIRGLEIIAAGGIRSAREIEVLKDMGVSGAILGKAVYDGRLDLGMCLDAADDRRKEEDEEPPLF